MKNTIAKVAAWSLVVVGAASAVWATSNAAGERGQGQYDFPVQKVDSPEMCEFTPSFLLGPEDLQQATVDTNLTQGYVMAFARGMEIHGYGHMYTGFADTTGCSAAVSKSASGFGSVTVKRTRAGSAHIPYMRLDWYPKFKAEAKVVEPDADCLAAGVMQGNSGEMDCVVCAAGGAAADGHTHNEQVKVTLGLVEIGLSSSRGDDNTAAPQDGRVRIRSIEEATASFSCQCTVKAAVPGALLFDWNEECESWIWESWPELDLHGCCGQCCAYGYATYGWTQ